MRYFTDFSTAHSDWTDINLATNSRVVDAGATGGYVLQLAKSGDIGALVWDRITVDEDNDDVEVLFKGKNTQGSGYNTFEMYAVLRASGTSDLDDGYRGGFYNGKIRVDKIVSGSVTSLSAPSYSWSSNTYYWVRFRANGTNLKLRVWADGSSEPETWNIETTDSALTDGFAGVGVNNYIGQSTKFDVVGIATDGETAPNTDVLDVETNEASSILWYGATLNGELLEYEGSSAVLSFEYGETTAYGSTANSSSTEEGTFSALVDDLDPETTYHFRAKAVADGYTIYGMDDTFETTEQTEMLAYNLSPDDDMSINPLIANTFTWDIIAPATQTHYEIEYKIVGAGSYTSTGAIESATQEHEFAIDFFDYDEDYEWRVKSYDSANSGDYDWSEVETFNTTNPPTISAETLEQDDEIQVGIHSVSAIVTSIYDRQCKLIVRVSTTSDFAEYTEDETVLDDSGEVHTVSVVFPYAGLWYVRYIAEDEEELTTTETITVDVIQTLYFIDEPSIQLQSLQATDVTVRVAGSDPEVSYTAKTDPEVSASSKVERLIEIDDGTAGVCQAVAEQLIERWGREKVSISGNISLNVSLFFKQKVHIFDAQNGIDGDYILQSKSHNVNDMTTSIVVGDIILDDSELLARIIDNLG